MKQFWTLCMDVLVLMFYINIVGMLLFFVRPISVPKQTQKAQIVAKAQNQHLDPIVKRYARLHGLDWRFVYAMIHVESRFQENALSNRGAIGLMQVMPAVGRDLKVADLYHPQENIKAGVRHFYSYLNRLKGNTLEDRIQMALAAYNGGIGHIYDAKRLAQSKGLDPFSWSSIKTILPQLEQKDVYQHSRHGYCQGRQMVHYVQLIQTAYRRYKTNFPALPTVRQPDANSNDTFLADASNLPNILQKRFF